MHTDLLSNPIVLLKQRRGALGRRQAKVLVIPGFHHLRWILAQQRLRRRRSLPVVLVVEDRDRYDRKLDAAGLHIGPERIERSHRIAAIGIDDHPQSRCRWSASEAKR